MLAGILQHTPLWVYAIFAYVISIGYRQSVDHRRALPRAVLMPLAMAALSLAGLWTTFAHEPTALAAWAIGLAVALVLARAFGAWPGVRWLPEQRLLQVPGSWLPLALLLGVFVVKFAVNVLLVVHPSLVATPQFVAITGLVYGAFSGAFVSRGIAMWLATRATWRATAA